MPASARGEATAAARFEVETGGGVELARAPYSRRSWPAVDSASAALMPYLRRSTPANWTAPSEQRSAGEPQGRRGEGCSVGTCCRLGCTWPASRSSTPGRAPCRERWGRADDLQADASPGRHVRRRHHLATSASGWTRCSGRGGRRPTIRDLTVRIFAREGNFQTWSASPGGSERDGAGGICERLIAGGRAVCRPITEIQRPSSTRGKRFIAAADEAATKEVERLVVKACMGEYCVFFGCRHCWRNSP